MGFSIIQTILDQPEMVVPPLFMETALPALMEPRVAIHGGVGPIVPITGSPGEAPKVDENRW